MKRLNYHLREPDRRSRFYRYHRDVPRELRSLVGKPVVTFSLKTTDPVEARQLRNEWDRHYEGQWSALHAQRKMAREARLVAEASKWREATNKPRKPLNPPTGPYAGLLIPTGELAEREPFGAWEMHELAKEIGAIARERLLPADRSDDQKVQASIEWVIQNSEQGRLVSRFIDTFKGRKSYVDLGKEYLDKGRKKGGGSLTETSKAEYGRAFKKADKYGLEPISDVTWEMAGSFLQKVADAEQLSDKSIGNIRTALSNLWAHYKRGRAVWTGHEVHGSNAAQARDPWLDRELRSLIKGADGHWLEDVIWIALYTGHRREAIAQIEYDAELDFIWFPALKSEEKPRYFPCHPHIRRHAQGFAAARKSASYIGNQFRELRDRLGLRPPEGANKKDFHSFRSNTTAQLMQKGLPADAINVVVGRKNASITTGVYGFKDLPPDAVDEINRWRPLIERVDWQYLLD